MAKNEQKRAKKVKKRASNNELYVCSKCDYNTSRHSNYIRHIETKKHLEKHEKVLKSVKSVKNGKSGKNFYCEACDYSASQKSHYDKHIRTKKHLIKMSNILDDNISVNTKMCENINSENDSPMSNTFSNDNSEIEEMHFGCLNKLLGVKTINGFLKFLFSCLLNT